jgi:hypothetical protein
MVMPVGCIGNGLPFGMQIGGPYSEDCTTITFARQLAYVIGGFQMPSGIDGLGRTILVAAYSGVGNERDDGVLFLLPLQGEGWDGDGFL